MVNRSTLENRAKQLAAILQGNFEEELPRWVPLTERGRLDLAERMSRDSEVLAERIAKNCEKPSDKRKDPEKIQVSLSDPMAPLGRDKLKVFRPLYTVQYVVAPGSYLIMAYDCKPDVTDVGTLAPMIDKTQKVVRGQLKTIIADAGYCSIVDLQDCRTRGSELLAPVQANGITKSKKKAPSLQQISRDQFDWDETKQCYRCPQGHYLKYQDRARNGTVADTFGNIAIAVIACIAAVADSRTHVFVPAVHAEGSRDSKTKSCWTTNERKWKPRRCKHVIESEAKRLNACTATVKEIVASHVFMDEVPLAPTPKPASWLSPKTFYASTVFNKIP